MIFSQKTKTKIGVVVEIEGLHSFPEATKLAGEQVSYLEYPHRHKFIITCEKEVHHDNRDIEFIVFQHQIQGYLTENYWSRTEGLCNFGSMSCEMIARELLEHYDLLMCKVSEDGGHYAVVEKNESNLFNF